MTHSLAEIKTAFETAARGCSWPTGIAEEFGRAAVWSVETSDLGMGQMLNMLEAGPVNSVVIPALSAFDTLASGEDECVLIACRDESILGLVGLAGAAAKAYELEFAFSGPRTGFQIGPNYLERGEIGQMGQQALTVRSGPVCMMGIGSTDAFGYRIDAGQWSRVRGLAAKTYAVASSTSRRLGAGVGSDDSD